jgi:hypothetical protein
MHTESVYRILSKLFYKENSAKSLNSLDKTLFALAHLQILLQNVKFLWSPALPINYWNSYLKFWVVLAYPSIDEVAAAINSSFVLLLIAISALTTIIFVVILHSLLSIYKKDTPMLFIKFARILIILVCDVYFIPCTIVLVILFKYSSINTNFIEEYANNPSSDPFQLGIFGQGLSLVFLGFILIISLINECCKFEIRHSLTDKIIEAKSFTYLGVYIKIVYFINSVLFCSVKVDFFFYYLVSIAIAHWVIWCLHIYKLIYYSNFVNFIKVTLHFEILCVALFFIIGSLLNNATVIIVLGVFMQPFIVIISKKIIEYRISKIRNLKEEIKSSFHIFEFSARKMLLSPENPEELIKFINKNFSITKNEILFVIQAYYCADVLKNSALGSIKLSRVNSESLSFFSGFQVYKCYKILEKINVKISEGFKLCLYLLNIDKILTQEKKLFRNLLRL